jgi:REP element-mobilizing transposase RayT
VTDQLLTQCVKHFVDIAAYCLMPDHLHALFVVDDSPGHIRACVERFKQLTGYAYARRAGHRLWQRSYFDYTLRSDEAIVPTVAYIVNNPVRAQFVRLPDAWPFWGSSSWSRADLLEAIASCGPGRRPG